MEETVEQLVMMVRTTKAQYLFKLSKINTNLANHTNVSVFILKIIFEFIIIDSFLIFQLLQVKYIHQTKKLQMLKLDVLKDWTVQKFCKILKMKGIPDPKKRLNRLLGRAVVQDLRLHLITADPNLMNSYIKYF